MTLKMTDPAYYSAIAGAIRAQLGVNTTYLPSQMSNAILTIAGGSGGGIANILKVSYGSSPVACYISDGNNNYPPYHSETGCSFIGLPEPQSYPASYTLYTTSAFGEVNTYQVDFDSFGQAKTISVSGLTYYFGNSDVAPIPSIDVQNESTMTFYDKNTSTAGNPPTTNYHMESLSYNPNQGRSNNGGNSSHIYMNPIPSSANSIVLWADAWLYHDSYYWHNLHFKLLDSPGTPSAPGLNRMGQAQNGSTILRDILLAQDQRTRDDVTSINSQQHMTLEIPHIDTCKLDRQNVTIDISDISIDVYPAFYGYCPNCACWSIKYE